MYNKVIFIVLVIMASALTSIGQANLIQNGSFEDIDSCPIYPNGPNVATGWFSPMTCNEFPGLGSNVFNSCCTNNNCGIPQNSIGFQYPHTGIGYSGIQAFNTIDSNLFRQYVSTKLIYPLFEAKRYHTSFYVSLASSWQSDCGASGLGAYFSNDSIMTCYDQDFPAIILDAHIKYSDTIPITDTTNWVLIQGEYIAKGGEQFLTIGNFLSGHLVVYDTTGLAENNYLGFRSFYYIDDVSVTEIDTSIGIPEPIQTNCKFYQAEDQKWVIESTGKPSKLSIYNNIGQLVYEHIPKQNKETILLSLDQGIYNWQAGVGRGKILIK